MHAQVQGALLVRRVSAAMLLPGIAELVVRKNQLENLPSDGICLGV